jgi:hypothetical protein
MCPHRRTTIEAHQVISQWFQALASGSQITRGRFRTFFSFTNDAHIDRLLFHAGFPGNIGQSHFRALHLCLTDSGCRQRGAPAG